METADPTRVVSGASLRPCHPPSLASWPRGQNLWRRDPLLAPLKSGFYFIILFILLFYLLLYFIILLFILCLRVQSSESSFETRGSPFLTCAGRGASGALCVFFGGVSELGLVARSARSPSGSWTSDSAAGEAGEWDPGVRSFPVSSARLPRPEVWESLLPLPFPLAVPQGSPCPGRCGSVVSAPACGPEGPGARFPARTRTWGAGSGPGPVGCVGEATGPRVPLPSSLLSPSRPLSNSVEKVSSGEG